MKFKMIDLDKYPEYNLPKFAKNFALELSENDFNNFRFLQGGDLNKFAMGLGVFLVVFSRIISNSTEDFTLNTLSNGLALEGIIFTSTGLLNYLALNHADSENYDLHHPDQVTYIGASDLAVDF